ncbi:MAG: RluA family pseudouridine synthase [Thermoflexales bacterium]|nr:RluA family pseudouridine synthase [Thermoflexales bacterium]MDW8351676.1 RluA family pseudouridine synthase [Anaerolineae bacterium]
MAGVTAGPITLTATHTDRLDKVVAALLPTLSRSAVQRLIAQGRVRVDAISRDADYRVQPGQTIVVDLPAPAPEAPQAEPIVLDIVYEDASVIVINKPAGMVVHPGPGNPSGTIVNAVLAYAPEVQTVGDVQRPGIVHRLDKDTSGLLLIARHEAALRALQSQFKARTIRKTYLALCVGRVSPEHGVISRPIGRDPSNRRRMAVIPGGREAVTEYVVIEVFGPDDRLPAAYALVRAHPLTGRTHQLRVHFASIGHPIVGDALYGMRKDQLTRSLRPRHMLHASELAFISPASGREVKLHAPLPLDMRRVLEELSSPSSLDQ